MTENWKNYFCNVNDKLASIALNLGLNEGAPIETKPWLLWVWVYLQHPTSDGLSQQSEFATVSSIEDALSKAAWISMQCSRGRSHHHGRPARILLLRRECEWF